MPEKKTLWLRETSIWHEPSTPPRKQRPSSRPPRRPCGRLLPSAKAGAYIMMSSPRLASAAAVAASLSLRVLPAVADARSLPLPLAPTLPSRDVACPAESRRLPLRARAESRPASFACPAEPAERQLRLLRRPCIPTLGLARLLSLRRWPGAGEGVERNRRRREGVGRVKLRRKEPREYNARIAYVLHAGGNRPEVCLLHRRSRLELLRGSRLPLLLGTATLVS